MEFEWDERKRQRNLDKHGIDFIRVRVLFDGRDVVSVPSPYPHEPRTLTIGVIDEALVTLVWTERGGKIRCISARPASRIERALFHKVFEG